MQTRFDFRDVAPNALEKMLDIETYLWKCGLDRSLLNLVKMRASQINGCAYCLDMHSKDARAEGETEQRLYVLDAWRETRFYSARERAALAWTEALTLIADTHAPDDVYRRLREQFSEREIADLSLAIVAINGWNRIAIGSRAEPGSYKPRAPARQPSAAATA
jgi:AhpD family alkylhydroperoxidase